MAYNRVNAMGVQHGLQSPEELMGADLARRAQMQALMSAGGRSAPGAEMPMPQQAEPQVLNNVGRPAWETDYMSRAAGQERQMQELQGGQAMDLQKQRGQDYLNAVKEQMAPAMGRENREQSEYDRSAPFRSRVEEERMKVLNGAPTGQDDLLRYSMLGVNPAPFLEERARKEGYARQDEQSQQAAINALVGELAKSNPEVASKLAGQSKAFAGIDPSLLQRGFGATGAQDFASVSANPQIADKIRRMMETITSNNLYFTEGDMSDLTKSYYELNTMLDSLRASPEAKAQILQTVKDKMRDAIAGTQGLWHGSGMGKIEQGFQLR